MGKHGSSAQARPSIPPESTATERSEFWPVTPRFERWVRPAAIIVKIAVGVLGLVILLSAVSELSLDVRQVLPTQQTASISTTFSAQSAV